MNNAMPCFAQLSWTYSLSFVVASEQTRTLTSNFYFAGENNSVERKMCRSKNVVVRCEVVDSVIYLFVVDSLKVQDEEQFCDGVFLNDTFEY